MIIERDYDKEADILRKVSSHIHGDTNRAKGKLQVHVSDLLWCMRQSFYKKVSERELTMDEVLKFFKGKVSEYAVGRFIFTEDHYFQQERLEGDNGIVAHPDIISYKDDIVIELKQTDKFSFVDPRDTIYNSFIYYVTQLMYYLYLAKKKNGTIIVNHSNYNMFSKKFELDDKDKNPFRIFSIKLDPEDFDMIENDLNFKQKLLQTALDKKEVGYLPQLVTIDLTDTSKCKRCIYKERCTADNDFWKDNKINKILAIRKDNLTQYLDENFKEFILTYVDSPIEKTGVNNLYNLMSKQFKNLGEHYK